MDVSQIWDIPYFGHLFNINTTRFSYPVKPTVFFISFYMIPL